MPRKKTTPGPHFYVFVMSYASLDVKARIEAGGIAQPGDLKADLVHMSPSEYRASQALFRACKAARRNELSYEVLVQAGLETIIDVTIKH